MDPAELVNLVYCELSLFTSKCLYQPKVASLGGTGAFWNILITISRHSDFFFCLEFHVERTEQDGNDESQVYLSSE